MLIDMDSGLIINSVHDDVATTNDDIECGTAGANSTIDADTIRTTIGGISADDKVMQATMPAITANDNDSDTVTTQHETPVLTTSDTTTPAVPATTIDIITAHATATATSDLSSGTATGNSKVKTLPMQSISNESTDTVSELALATKKPFWSEKVVQASKSVTNATQNAVAAHGDKAILALELVGAIAQRVPYIKTAYGLCNEVVQLFQANAYIDSNCAEVVAWAKDMQVCYCIYIYVTLLIVHAHVSHTPTESSIKYSLVTSIYHVEAQLSCIPLYIRMNVSVCYSPQKSTLDTLQGHIEAYPASGADINLSLMDKVNATLTELKALALKHQSSNMLTKFALSRKTQSLLNEATQWFTEATSKLHLNLAVTQYGVNLRIDENISVLVR
jgi:hypothetical protein